MDFFIRIAEKYILANRKLRKLKRAVSVMMAITVFVTSGKRDRIRTAGYRDRGK